MQDSQQEPPHSFYNPPYLHRHQQHRDEYDLYLVPRSTIPVTLGLEAQDVWAEERGSPTYFGFPDQAVGVLCGYSSLESSHMVLHKRTSPSLNLEYICLCASPQGVLSVL